MTNSWDLPDTEVCSAALDLVLDVSTECIAIHTVRSYLFARELAAAKGLRDGRDYDDELVYLTCVLLSTIWSLGDFNSVYLLTGGGPIDSTQVLATLGVRYLRMDQVDVSLAAIIVAMPAVIPIVWFMMKRLSGEHVQD